MWVEVIIDLVRLCVFVSQRHPRVFQQPVRIQALEIRARIWRWALRTRISLNLRV